MPISLNQTLESTTAIAPVGQPLVVELVNRRIAVRIASRLVPTYFSTTAAAISNATTFSTITLAAGTAQTSDRSYAAGCGALVAMLIDGPRAASVLIGFLAARTTIGSPLDVPPSMPPALLVGRRKPWRRSSGGVVRLVGDRVHHLRSRPPRGFDAEADLDGLDRLDAHDGGGQPGIELAVPLGVAAQPDRAAGDDRFDHAPQRVAGLARGIDRGDDRRVDLRSSV